MNEIAIKLVNVSKNFGGIQAVIDANLEIKERSIHVFMGENGAGKSTLGKLISGFHKPDKGEIYVHGEKFHGFSSPLEAYNKGIYMVYQETTLCPDLKVRDNLILGSEISVKLDRKHEEDLIREKLTPFSVNFELPSLEVKVSQLSSVEKKIVDICRGLIKNSKIFILDEPTSSLGLKETRVLLKLVEHLRDEGHTIIFVTHKMEEALQIADYITIMREGKIINTYPKDQFQDKILLRDMVGEDFQEKNIARNIDRISDNKPLFKAFNFSGKVGKTKINNVNFELYRGEILGFAGLVGAGRSELFSLILGINKKDSGKIFFEDKEIKDLDPLLAIRKGIVYLHEERPKNGFLDFTVLRNITMPKLGLKPCDFVSHSVVIKKKERAFCDKVISDFKIVGTTNTLLSSLSGGNQQKVLLAKLLTLNPKIIILDEPTIGVDIPTKNYIYSLMNSFADSGGSIILISSDTDEILRVSDRIIIFKNGTIKNVLKNNHNKEVILNLLLLDNNEEVKTI